MHASRLLRVMLLCLVWPLAQALAADIAVDDIVVMQDKKVAFIDMTTKTVIPLSGDALINAVNDVAVYRAPDGTDMIYIVGSRGSQVLYAYDPQNNTFDAILDNVRTDISETASFEGVTVENDGSILVTCDKCGSDEQLQILRVPPDSTYWDMKYEVLTQSAVMQYNLGGIDVGPDGTIYAVCMSAPAALWSVVEVDPDSGATSRLAFSPGGDDMEMKWAMDVDVSRDGRIFVQDTRWRETGDDEMRIIEVDPSTGAQTMLNDSAKEEVTEFRGISSDSSGRNVYFWDGKVSNTGKEGVSYLDLDGTLDPDGQYYRQSLLSAGGLRHGMDVVKPAVMCPSVTLDAASAAVPGTGDTVALDVAGSATRARCGWSVTRDVGWISPSLTTGFGTQQMNLDVQFSQEAVARTGKVTIGDKTFTVTQEAGSLRVLSGDELPVGQSTSMTFGADDRQYYYFYVPPGATMLTVTLHGLTTNADMFLRFGAHAEPEQYIWDCRPFWAGTDDEICTVELPSPGNWGLIVDAWSTVPGTGIVTVEAPGASSAAMAAPILLLLQ